MSLEYSLYEETDNTILYYSGAYSQDACIGLHPEMKRGMCICRYTTTCILLFLKIHKMLQKVVIIYLFKGVMSPPFPLTMWGAQSGYDEEW